MALQKRQDIDTSALKGVVLAVDEAKIKPGVFVRLSNWRPSGIDSIQKKRGVALLDSIAITPPTPTEDCVGVVGAVAPTAPSNLVATTAVGDNSFFQIDLTWTDNSADETHFSIERCAGAACANFLEVNVVDADVTSYSDTTLEADTTYVYRIRAYNSGGASAYSSTATATTSVLPAVPPGVDLALWLDANQILGLVEGDPVSTWSDESGNGFDFIGSLTVRPTYRASSINSLPGIEFDGVNDVLTNTDLDTSLWTGASVFIVGKVDADPPTTILTTGHWKFNDADEDARFPYTDGVIYETIFTTVRKVVGDPPTSLTLPHQYNVISTAGDFRVRVNRVDLYTTTVNTFQGQTGAVLNKPNAVGRSGGFFYKGVIAELIIFEGVLDNTDRNLVETYLALKWDL